MAKKNNKEKSLFRQKVERADRVSRRIITIGGYGIIISIALILLFLVFQSLPLTYGADIEEWLTISGGTPKDQTVLTGVDPYLEVFYDVTEHGLIHFYRIADKKIIQTDTLKLDATEKILTASKGPFNKELFAVGTNAGNIITALIDMKPDYKDFKRVIIPNFKILESYHVPVVNDSIPNHVEKMVMAQNEDGSNIWVWIDHTGALKQIGRAHV